MNRRKFLLGCIASPIAAKVDAVSAALRPMAAPIPIKWISFAEYIRAKDPLSQEMIDMFIHTNDLMETITWRDQPPLDSRREPWHDDKAGRDQIG
jgi:hypothetical protein